MALTYQSRPSSLFVFTHNPIGFTVAESDPDLAVFKIELTFGHVDEGWSGTNTHLEYPDADGAASFDMSELVKGIMETNLHFPNYGEDTDTLYEPAIMVINVVSLDSDGEQINALSSYFYQVYWGGINWEKWNRGNYFTQWLPDQKTFLSWQPNNQKVDRSQQLWLSFLFLEEPVDSAVAAFIVYWSDGSTTTGGFHAISDIAAADYVTFSCGYANTEELAALEALYPSKTILKYDVWLKVDDVVVSEVKTFYLDTTFHRSTKRLLWRNSLNGVDSLLCNGSYIEEFEYTGDETLIYWNHDYEVKDGQRRAFEHQEQGHFTLSTGWKTREEIDHLRDALLTLELYLDDGDEFIPIKIDRDTLRFFTSEQKLFGVQFKYQTLFKNKVFTPARFSTDAQAQARLTFTNTDPQEDDTFQIILPDTGMGVITKTFDWKNSPVGDSQIQVDAGDAADHGDEFNSVVRAWLIANVPDLILDDSTASDFPQSQVFHCVAGGVYDEALGNDIQFVWSRAGQFTVASPLNMAGGVG